jgi:Phage integrase family
MQSPFSHPRQGGLCPTPQRVCSRAYRLGTHSIPARAGSPFSRAPLSRRGRDRSPGYIFSPLIDRAAPFSRYYFSEVVGRALKPLSRELTLHSLRHTFVTWRLEMGDPMARVQGLTGHADANTLMRYAHIAPDPLADLLPFLRTPPGFPPNPLSKSSSPFPPDKRDPLENLDG